MAEMTVKREHNAVLKIVKFPIKKSDKLIEVLEDKSLDWIEVLGYLCYHRVAGLAYENINSVDVRKLDFPVFFTTYMIHQSQGMRTNLQRRYIKSISSKFSEFGIEHVFLKGSVLSGTIYPIGTRASNDIDILVSKKSILDTKKTLEELGFVQGICDYRNNFIKEFDQQTIEQSLATRGEMAPFIKIVNETTLKTVDVDVNFSLDWTPNGTGEVVGHFLEERVLVPIDNDFSIYSLRNEHLFIQLCSHLYKDSVILDLVKKRKVLDLYKFVDIYVFIQKYFEKIDVDKIFDDSVKYGFDKHVFFALNYTTKVFPEIVSLNNVKLLLRRFKYINDSVMTVVFDQYDSENQMKDTGSLIDRLFAYNIIKNYH